MNVIPLDLPVTVTPSLRTEDTGADYWLRQVTIRLRREIAWLRYLHENRSEVQSDPILPPYTDPLQTNLDQQRFWDEKQRYLSNDPTAQYLTYLLEAPPGKENTSSVRGSFSWVVDTLGLDDLSAFVLALSLAPVLDDAVGVVISACMNDPNRSLPTLALAQKLWDSPNQLLQIADPSNAIFRYRLVQVDQPYGQKETSFSWQSVLRVPILVARNLLSPTIDLPHSLELVHWKDGSLNSPVTDSIKLFAAKLTSKPIGRLILVPILGAKGAGHLDIAKIVSRETSRRLMRYVGSAQKIEDEEYMNSLATLGWLRDIDLFIDGSFISTAGAEDLQRKKLTLPDQAIPVVFYLAITEKNQIPDCPDEFLSPALRVPDLTYQERVLCWENVLGRRANELKNEIREVARRYRYGKEMIASIGETLDAMPGDLTVEDLYSACREAMLLDIGELAQRVEPRFQEEILVLPPKQGRLFEEVIHAMRSLTKVHYEWGTAKVWNESGLAVLFTGPPGTGKTMGAEILAEKLNLPMYRVDLSQVVNKYIGETEKNLKKLFDAADITDIILFFDEADALFGKRTEVKDSHDRYANLEISYLLERMERFKGIAILATNRKKDLDEAFLRRLRYIIDFPIPNEEQRKKIWDQVVPKSVDKSEIDFDFLAKNFRLAGGHIRSIIFNACLQSADLEGKKNGKYKGKLTMESIIVATRREFDKLNRPISDDNFGIYIETINRMERLDAQDQDRQN